MTDLQEDDLRTIFADITAPPSRLTSLEAVEFGRRGKRNRRAGIAAAGLVIAVVATVGVVATTATGPHHVVLPADKSITAGPEPGTTPATCSSTVAGPPNAANILGVDPTGRWILGTTVPGGEFIWHDGVMTTIDGSVTSQPPLGGIIQLSGMMLAIDSRGEALGNRYTDNIPAPPEDSTSHTVISLMTGRPVYQPFIYANGHVADLPLPAGQPNGGKAISISGDGDVAGYLQDETSGHVPVVWTADDRSHPRVLSTPQGWTGAVAVGVNAAGIVAGYATNSVPGPKGMWLASAQDVGPHKPYMWDAHGVAHALETLPGLPYGEVTAVAGNYAYGYLGDLHGGAGPKLNEPGFQDGWWDLRSGKFTTFDPPGHQGRIISGNVHGDFIVDYDHAAYIRDDEAVIGGLRANLLPIDTKTDSNLIIGVSDDRQVFGLVWISDVVGGPDGVSTRDWLC